MNEVNVVTIDISKLAGDDYVEFQRKTAEEKIEILSTRINDIYKKLEQNNPNSLTIIAWREGGITDINESALNQEQKKLLKEKMQALTNQHKNLMVIAGSVSTIKSSITNQKAEQIKDAYKQNKWIEEKEEKSIFATDKQMKLEHRKLNNSKKWVERNALRNTSYIFYRNKISRHDKTAPYHETERQSQFQNLIFQPGKDRNLSSSFTFENENLEKPLNICVEICMEHIHGVVKNKKAHDFDIHFILSDTLDPYLDNICGLYAIQIDSHNKSKLLIMRDPSGSKLEQRASDLSTRHYHSDLLDPQSPLLEELPPIYPFQLFMKEALTQLIIAPSPLKELGESIKSDFEKNSIFMGSIGTKTLQALKGGIEKYFDIINKMNLDIDTTRLISVIDNINARIETEINANRREDYIEKFENKPKSNP